MTLMLEFLLQLFLEFLGQALLEVGWESAKQALGRENHHPVVAALGFLVLGAVVGAAWVWIQPDRIAASSPLPGASLILAPLLVGASMHVFGSYRRAHGHNPTNLATFFGGASFAFAVAAVRFVSTSG